MKLSYLFSMIKTILVILMIIFGSYNRAYCQDINVEQSLKNTKIAWESIFPNKKCVLLHKRHEEYETNVYEIKHFKYDLVKTYSRSNPYKLKVRIEIEYWSSRERKMSIKDALANLVDREDGVQRSDTANFPLTALYAFKDGSWVFSAGNKWMMLFLKRARARYNKHVNITRIISIPEK